MYLNVLKCKSTPEYEKMAEMIYFGYTMNYGMGIPSSAEARKAAACTQQYVWEYVHNNIDSSYGVPSRSSWNSNYMSSSIYSNWLSNAESNYNNYHNNNVSFNGQTTKVNVGESTTLKDNNGVLAAYPSFTQTVNGVTFKHTQGSNEIIADVSSSTKSGTASFSSTALASVSTVSSASSGIIKVDCFCIFSTRTASPTQSGF